MNKLDKTLSRLVKRKRWLDDRIAEARAKGKDLSYDKAESSALEYAIEKLEEEKEKADE